MAKDNPENLDEFVGDPERNPDADRNAEENPDSENIVKFKPSPDGNEIADPKGNPDPEDGRQDSVSKLDEDSEKNCPLIPIGGEQIYTDLCQENFTGFEYLVVYDDLQLDPVQEDLENICHQIESFFHIWNFNGDQHITEEERKSNENRILFGKREFFCIQNIDFDMNQNLVPSNSVSQSPKKKSKVPKSRDNTSWMTDGKIQKKVFKCRFCNKKLKTKFRVNRHEKNFHPLKLALEIAESLIQTKTKN